MIAGFRMSAKDTDTWLTTLDFSLQEIDGYNGEPELWVKPYDTLNDWISIALYTIDGETEHPTVIQRHRSQLTEHDWAICWSCIDQHKCYVRDRYGRVA